MSIRFISSLDKATQTLKYFSLLQTSKVILALIEWEEYIEGFLKIDTLSFELSHRIELSLRSLSTI